MKIKSMNLVLVDDDYEIALKFNQHILGLELFYLAIDYER